MVILYQCPPKDKERKMSDRLMDAIAKYNKARAALMGVGTNPVKRPKNDAGIGYISTMAIPGVLKFASDYRVLITRPGKGSTFCALVCSQLPEHLTKDSLSTNVFANIPDCQGIPRDGPEFVSLSCTNLLTFLQKRTAHEKGARPTTLLLFAGIAN
jgi:hypothetical protein